MVRNIVMYSDSCELECYAYCLDMLGLVSIWPGSFPNFSVLVVLQIPFEILDLSLSQEVLHRVVVFMFHCLILRN